MPCLLADKLIGRSAGGGGVTSGQRWQRDLCGQRWRPIGSVANSMAEYSAAVTLSAARIWPTENVRVGRQSNALGSGRCGRWGCVCDCWTLSQRLILPAHLTSWAWRSRRFGLDRAFVRVDLRSSGARMDRVTRRGRRQIQNARPGSRLTSSSLILDNGKPITSAVCLSLNFPLK